MDVKGLREYRLLNGLTLPDLVKYGNCPVTDKYVGRVETGVEKVKAETLKEIYNSIARARFNKDKEQK